jgi:hypothetical protein
LGREINSPPWREKENCLLGILENWKDGKMGKAKPKDMGSETRFLESWNNGMLE